MSGCPLTKASLCGKVSYGTDGKEWTVNTVWVPKEWHTTKGAWRPGYHKLAWVPIKKVTSNVAVVNNESAEVGEAHAVELSEVVSNVTSEVFAPEVVPDYSSEVLEPSEVVTSEVFAPEVVADYSSDVVTVEPSPSEVMAVEVVSDYSAAVEPQELVLNESVEMDAVSEESSEEMALEPLDKV